MASENSEGGVASEKNEGGVASEGGVAVANLSLPALQISFD